MKVKSVCRPTIPVWDARFKYVPARLTDVAATWARHGWVAPSSKKEANNG